MVQNGKLAKFGIENRKPLFAMRLGCSTQQNEAARQLHFSSAEVCPATHRYIDFLSRLFLPAMVGLAMRRGFS
jgi:hypothetical protein